MDWDMTAKAIFVPITYYTLTVDVSPSSGGDIKVNGTALSSYPNSSTFAQGTSVELRAVPAPGYEFDHWSGVPSDSEKENPTTIPVASATKVTAHFTKPASFPWWLILVGIAAFLLAIIMGRLVYRLTTRRTSIQAH